MPQTAHKSVNVTVLSDVRTSSFFKQTSAVTVLEIKQLL